MSYTISVGKLGRHVSADVEPMWEFAMPEMNMASMNGKTSTDCLPHLEAGMRHMELNPTFHSALVPGHGDALYKTALSVLREMAAECDKDPEIRVTVFH